MLSYTVPIDKGDSIVLEYVDIKPARLSSFKKVKDLNILEGSVEATHP